MSRLVSIESKLYAFLAAIFMSSCIGQSTIEPNLDTVVSFNMGHSQDFISAVLFENSTFPCAIPDNCPPTPISLATISVRTNRVGGRALDLIDDPFLGPFFINTFEIDLAPNEQVTVQVLFNQITYLATETMPDTSDKVIDFAYLASAATPGLFIRFDQENLDQTEAVYVQLFANQNPIYGYVIFPDLKESSQIPSNGFYDPGSEQYYISEDELAKSNPQFLTRPGDVVTLRSRTITGSSTEFFLAYRRAILNGEFNLNDGLFFAPPKNLPTNFDNGGFGMFHLYHEQELERVAR